MTASIAHASGCLPEVVTPADMHREVFGTTNLFVLVYETGVSSQACDATSTFGAVIGAVEARAGT